jgi:hypothetical protein
MDTVASSSLAPTPHRSGDDDLEEEPDHIWWCEFLFWTYQRFSGEKCGTQPYVPNHGFWKRREHTPTS